EGVSEQLGKGFYALAKFAGESFCIGPVQSAADLGQAVCYEVGLRTEKAAKANRREPPDWDPFFVDEAGNGRLLDPLEAAALSSGIDQFGAKVDEHRRRAGL